MRNSHSKYNNTATHQSYVDDNLSHMKSAESIYSNGFLPAKKSRKSSNKKIRSKSRRKSQSKRNVSYQVDCDLCRKSRSPPADFYRSVRSVKYNVKLKLPSTSKSRSRLRSKSKSVKVLKKGPIGSKSCKRNASLKSIKSVKSRKPKDREKSKSAPRLSQKRKSVKSQSKLKKMKQSYQSPAKKLVKKKKSKSKTRSKSRRSGKKQMRFHDYNTVNSVYDDRGSTPQL